jgi:hypothetical protein
MLGRAVRALDQEVQFEYLAQIAEHEQVRIDRLVADHPPSGRLKVSIVVPTYRIAMAYIRELIASVERQAYANWELCFADDCDPERDVSDHLAALAREHPDRFKYTRHAENRGVAAATRTGLTLVTGDLVAFVDADDLLHRRALEAVVSRFEAHERVDFVYTDHDTASDLGFRRSPIRKPGFSPELLQSVNYINHLVVVRRTCLNRCEGAFSDETSGSQDWDLCLRLVGAARRVSHVPAVLYHWRGRAGSLAADRRAKPWVREASVATQQRHMQRIDERLCVVPEKSGQQHLYGPALRPEVELPSVRVVAVSRASVEAAAPPPVAYAGQVSTTTVRYAEGSTNGGILDGLREQCGDDPEQLLWLIEPRRPVPQGDLSKLVAFAVQAEVGAVWPFRAEAIRLCYTLHPGADRLAQVTHPANVFSRYSGNVLTGPLHGMLIRAKILRACVERVEQLEPRGGAASGFWERPSHLDSVGASIGLAALASGQRNVGCRGMVCDLLLEEALVPRIILPDHDPWH